LDYRQKKAYRKKRGDHDQRVVVRERVDRDYIPEETEEVFIDVDMERTISTSLDAKGPRSSFVDISPKMRESLTDSHYFLLPRRLNGFALAQKQRSNPYHSPLDIG
jgi:hypothetical protein